MYELAPSLLLSLHIIGEIALATRHRRRIDLTGVGVFGSC